MVIAGLLPNLRGLRYSTQEHDEMWLLQGSLIYLQQIKEAVNSYPKLYHLKGRLSHCLYTLFGQLHVDFFFHLAALSG